MNYNIFGTKQEEPDEVEFPTVEVEDLKGRAVALAKKRLKKMKHVNSYAVGESDAAY